MQLSDIHRACIFFAAADAHTDFPTERDYGAAYEDRRITFLSTGKDEHAAFHKIAYDACMAHLAVTPELGQARLQLLGEIAILDALVQLEAESHVQGGLG